MLVSLLSKAAQQKLEILHFLEHSPLQEATLQDLCEQLDFTDYLVKKSLRQIIDDLQTYEISSIHLKVKKKKVLFFSTGVDSIDSLQLIYLKQSNSFLLIDYLFRENDISLETFSKKHYLSLSSTYVLKSDVEKELELHNINLDANLHITGNEIQIRSFFYQMYFKAFNTLEFPFPQEFIELSKQFIEILERIDNKKYAPTQHLRIQFFLCIAFQRLYVGHSLSENNSYEYFLKDDELNAGVEWLFQWYETHTNLDNKTIRSELHFLLNFLFAENLLPEKIAHNFFVEIMAFKNETQRMTDTFLEEVFSFFVLDIDEINFKDFKNEILRAHFKVNRFDFLDKQSSVKIQFEFLKENYPDFYFFIDDFLRKHPKFYQKSKTLPYVYLFLLIEYVPLAEITSPIRICVDFSLSQDYNRFIIKNIRSFASLNVTIEKTLTDATDLYISDYVPQNLHCRHILWKTPPIPSDWEHFGNKIIEIKKERGSEHEAQENIS